MLPDLTMPQAVLFSVALVCWVVFIIARASGE